MPALLLSAQERCKEPRASSGHLCLGVNTMFNLKCQERTRLLGLLRAGDITCPVEQIHCPFGLTRNEKKSQIVGFHACAYPFGVNPSRQGGCRGRRRLDKAVSGRAVATLLGMGCCQSDIRPSSRVNISAWAIFILLARFSNSRHDLSPHYDSLPCFFLLFH